MQKSVSLADQIFEKLERDILSGTYQKGDIIVEMKLCEELGVSRTPVREALKKLEQEHLIEDCGKGMLVIGITYEDAEHIYRIREKIEGMAAAECARNITEEQLRELTEYVDLQEFYALKGDSEKVKSMDSNFHEAVYRFSGIAVYYDTLSPLHKKIQKYRKSLVEQKSRASQSTDEHRAILEAITAHDPKKAEESMDEHVKNAHARLLGLGNQQ
ncbi:MAG: GntR family transcriptional regulator [Oscillospiraceae bacterium]|nr:GntR family transcriptional regulator [Oscillospiraceae bacterium]